MTCLQAAFDILGISPDSDDAAIKTAWRALVRTYHPDMARSDPKAANRRLAEINAAFDAVCACTDAERREFREQAALRQRMREEAKRAQDRRNTARAARAAQARQEAGRATAGPRAAAAPGDGSATSGHRERAGSGPSRPHAAFGAGDDRALWHLAQKAAMAFRTAQTVCSRDLKAEPRSAYF